MHFIAKLSYQFYEKQGVMLSPESSAWTGPGDEYNPRNEETVAADSAGAASIGKSAPGARFIRVAFLGVTMLAALCIGLVFGWGPFAKILEEEGVGAAACGADARRPCEAQSVLYSLLYTLGSPNARNPATMF